ncbi:hypothetical protein HI914_02505 [Erysiphe necator]|nr:hypothetical protein HI914_02505 [Erysiphe necator]
MVNSNHTRKMPADFKILVPKYMGSSKLTAQFFRQIRTAFEDADIEPTPNCFFNVIIMQSWRMVACMDDSSCATEDEVVTCRDLLMTQFAPVEIEQKNGWMAELNLFRQEKTETLNGILDKVENILAEKHLLKTLCMAYYMGLNDHILKQRVFQQ